MRQPCLLLVGYLLKRASSWPLAACSDPGEPLRGEQNHPSCGRWTALENKPGRITSAIMLYVRTLNLLMGVCETRELLVTPGDQALQIWHI